MSSSQPIKQKEEARVRKGFLFLFWFTAASPSVSIENFYERAQLREAARDAQ
jgi:hypothetical protein